jgi:hypothetical protein
MSNISEPFKRDLLAEEKSYAEIARECADIGVNINSPWDYVERPDDNLWTFGVAAIFARHLERSHLALYSIW